MKSLFFITVFLLATAGAAAQTPDAYEPNDNLQTATALPLSFANGSATVKTTAADIHIVGDVDYYYVVMPPNAGGMFKAQLYNNWNTADGNSYTLPGKFSYSLNGGETWSSTSYSGFNITSIPADTIYFKVESYYTNSGTGTYALEVTVIADFYEPNNTVETAAVLPFAFAANDSAFAQSKNALIHIAGDVDYYRVNLPVRNADITAFFTAKLKNSYFESENSTYTLPGKFSYSIDGGATWSGTTYSQFAATALPNYCNFILFKVEGWSNSNTGTYVLEVNAGLQQIPVDSYEPNDNVATAAVLPVVWNGNTAQLKTDTASIHINSNWDYYRVNLPASANRMIQFKTTFYYKSFDMYLYYSTDGGVTWSSGYGSWGGGMSSFIDVPYGCNTVYFYVKPYITGTATGKYGLQIDLKYATDNDYWWHISNDTLYVNGNGATPDYNDRATPWYPFLQNIQHIVVSPGVTTIGKESFAYLQKVKTVSLPEGITQFGNYVFYGTDSLKTITLPSTLTTMGTGVFERSGITSVIIPNGVSTMGERAFMTCTKLTSVQLPPNLTSIGTEAFRDCSNLTSIHLPSGLLTLGQNVFYNSALTTVNIPATLTTANNAFQNCPLANVTFDNGCVTVPERIFANCATLTTVNIPNSITSIGTYAFSRCTKLQNFNFHNTLTTIGRNAFEYTALKSLVIPNNVTEIGYNTFNYCDSLETVSIGSGITNVKDGTFAYCRKLSNVTLPSNLTIMEQYAFAYCSALKQISLPASLTTIGFYAFRNSGLTSVHIPENVRTMGAYVFADCPALTDFSAANGITYLGGKAFYNDTSLVNVTLPASLTVIDDNAFYGCKKLTSIVLPQRVTTIYSYAFYNSGLTAITIPSSVTSIQENAFYGCNGLKNIVIPSSVTSLGARVFKDCAGLKELRFSRSSAPGLGTEVVAGALALDTIWVPQGALGSYVTAFSGKLPDRTPATVIAEMGVSQQIPNIANAQPPFATFHTQYSYPIYVTGVDTIVFEVIAGALPQGLTLNSAGVISGYPLEVGNFTFTVKATNSYGTDTQAIHFGVQQKNVGGGTFTFLNEFNYTGLPVMPSYTDFIYVLGEDTLRAETDFVIDLRYYYNNINKGSNAYFYIYGTGNFKSNTWTYFTIGKAGYTYVIPAAIAVQQGNGLDDIAEDVPKTATGVNGQQVTGATAWYSNTARTTPAVDSDLSTLALGAQKTLYWKFQPDSVKNANYTGQSKIGETQFTAQNLPPLVYAEKDTFDLGKRVIYISDTATVNVGGRYLTQPLAMQISGADAQYFSFSKPADWKDKKGGGLKIAFRPEELRFYDAELILSSATARDTVHLTGKGIMPTSYTVAAQVAQDIYAPQDTIEIMGTATYSNNMPAANVRVDMVVSVMGYNRSWQLTTDGNGNFTQSFAAQMGEAGHYTVKAYKPGSASQPVLEEFDIPGYKMTSSYVRWEVFKDIPVAGNIQFQNRSNIPLNNIRFEVLEGLPNAEVTLSPITRLAGGAYAMLNYSVTGTAETTSGMWEAIKLRATCDEGVTYDFTVWFYCKPTRGVLTVNPASIKTNMTKGSSKLVEVEITNNGNGPTGNIAVLIPNVEWMSLSSADTLPSLNPTETTKISLWLEPKATTPLNTPFTGNLAVNCSNGNSITIPYNIQAVSESTGTLVIDVVDEYYYNTAEAPHLRDAHVLVKHPYSFVTIADGYTDASGIFTVPNIPEGYWTVMVEAPNHESYRNNVLIEAGQTLDKFIFISFNAISYTWNVVPTEIEDHYEITLTAQYQTNVPVPVVQVNMPTTMPYLVGEEEYHFNMILTNLGLITAEEVNITFQDDNEYEFVYFLNGFNLAAHQSQVVPVTMRRKDSGGYQPSPILKAASSSSNCFESVSTSYMFNCGPIKNLKVSVNGYQFSGREGCFGTGTSGYGGYYLPGGGGGYYGGGGGGSANNNTVIPPSIIPEKCCPEEYGKGNCILDISQTVVGFLPGVDCVMAGISGITVGVATGGDAPGAVVDAGIGCIPIVGDIYSVSKTVWNCICAFAGGNGGSGGGGGPKPAPAANDNSIDWETTANKLDKVGDFISILNRLQLEVYGNQAIMDNENFVAFNEAIQPYTSQKMAIPVDDYNVISTGMPDNLYLPFISRWNNTLLANAVSVFNPNETYPNIISKDTLDFYGDSLLVINQYAIDNGYEGVGEMYADALNDINDYTQDEINNGVSEGVCASVTMEIKQRMTMTREAFRGTLTIHNGHNTLAMENVRLDLEVRDEVGDLKNELFQINTESLTGALTAVDGSGTLNSGSDGAANILFIPEVGAAPTETLVYSFGGILSYDDPFTGTRVSVKLFPVALEVHPSPYLDLHYFMQRDILGDDPLTEPIEPMIPADLAVMIHNKGYGMAKNVQIESAQPKIVENEKGLLINFNIIGSSLGSQPKQLGMMNVNFGNIQPQTATVGHWWLTSSLLGHFVSYDARITHLDSYGNPDLSLVDKIDIHELIHSVKAYGDKDDGILDFLVNDHADSRDYPDGLYYSDASYAPVHIADTAYTNRNVSTDNLVISLSVRPSETGWNYARMNDPARGKYKLAQVTRNDGVPIPLENVWQTFVTLNDNHSPVYEDKLHIADDFPTTDLYTYNLVFSQINTNTLKVDSIAGLPKTQAGQTVPVITEQQSSVTVYFDRPIHRPSLTIDDLELHNQGGLNLIDNSVTIDSISPAVYRVNFGLKTTKFGYYNFIVNTLDIIDLNRNSGYLGKQVEWIQDIAGIDSIITASICAGDSYLFGDKLRTEAGTYYDTIPRAAQRDSIVLLQLTVNPTYNLTDSVTIQLGELPYSYRDTIFDVGTVSDKYVFYRKTALGCDSIVTLVLTINIINNISEIQRITDVLLVPNPVNAGSNIRVEAEFTTDEQNGLYVEVFNSTGVKIRQFVPKTYPIYITDLNKSGIYIVRITTGSGNVYHGKLIVK